MTQKDRVMNLFRFMMDLLDEDTQITPSNSEPKLEKKLRNPELPHHPLLNPYVSELTPPTEPIRSPFSDPNSLFSKMAEIDKRNAEELGKLRAVKTATKPLIEQLESLKTQAHENALEVKREEELELLSDDIKTRMGVTIENGVAKVVEVPSLLRDKIPVEPTNNAVGYTINNSNELKGLNDLPKEVREKIESELANDSYLKNTKLPNVTITETTVELDNNTGEVIMKPTPKKPRVTAKSKVAKKPAPKGRANTGRKTTRKK